MEKIPQCPDQLPANIGDLVKKLGRLWAESEACPHIKKQTMTAWDKLIREWAEDNALPLLVRKSSLVRGSEIIHESGRSIIPTDNSPAQWACHLALRDIIPTRRQIHEYFLNDSIPVSFAHKKEEKEQRKYHCTIGQFTINKDGWKLCHISAVGLKTRSPLQVIDIKDLKRAFCDLLSPSNYFVLPKDWGGLGETPDFIEGFRNSASPNQAL